MQRRSKMPKFPIIKTLTVACFTLAMAMVCHAQSRTWVSGVGDDLNPCSRTAPCKTWAGAFSKTAINGEIDALDPGGFGTLTITKSITIEGTYGAGFGSTVASGATAGFIINISTTANDPLRTVRLRNLSINGTGMSGTVGTRTGVNGVRISSATAANTTVFIENCLITDFSNRGITFEANNGGKLFVSDTTVRNCGASAVVIFPASGSTKISATLDNVRLLGNASSGLVADNGSRVSISNSIADGNLNGVVAEASAGTSELNVHNCIINHNTTGILSGPGSVVVRISDNSVQNNATGVNVTSGTVITYGTNRINGNTTADVTGLLTAAGGPTNLLGTK